MILLSENLVVPILGIDSHPLMMREDSEESPAANAMLEDSEEIEPPMQPVHMQEPPSMQPVHMQDPPVQPVHMQEPPVQPVHMQEPPVQPPRMQVPFPEDDFADAPMQNRCWCPRMNSCPWLIAGLLEVDSFRSFFATTSNSLPGRMTVVMPRSDTK